MTRCVAGDTKPLNTTSGSAKLNSSFIINIKKAVNPIGNGSKAYQITPTHTMAVINFPDCENVSGSPKYNSKNITIAARMLTILCMFSLLAKYILPFCVLMQDFISYYLSSCIAGQRDISLRQTSI